MLWGNREWNGGGDKILISHGFNHFTLGAIAFPMCLPCISTLHTESGRGNLLWESVCSALEKRAS